MSWWQNTNLYNIWKWDANNTVFLTVSFAFICFICWHFNYQWNLIHFKNINQPTDWSINQPTNQPKTVRYEVLRAVSIKITVSRMGTPTEIYHCFGARCCLQLKEMGGSRVFWYSGYLAVSWNGGKFLIHKAALHPRRH